MGAGEGTKTAGLEAMKTETSKRKREGEIRWGRTSVDGKATSMFLGAGGKHAPLETANRSECIFLASTFEKPYMKW